VLASLGCALEKSRSDVTETDVMMFKMVHNMMRNSAHKEAYACVLGMSSTRILHSTTNLIAASNNVIPEASLLGLE
jgi:hypothetical protein